MQQQNQYHQEGNNYEAVKAKRVLVNLFREGTGTQIYGRYFFDEYPELINKTIVGIKFNQNLDSQQDVGSDFEVFADYSATNLGLPINYIDSIFSRNLFMNLYNSNNELIVQNFPISCLNQPLEPISSNDKFGNITPFDVKLNLKASYIFVTAQGNPAAKCALSLTFYYLDK
jgi:hypothetical protein